MRSSRSARATRDVSKQHPPTPPKQKALPGQFCHRDAPRPFLRQTPWPHVVLGGWAELLPLRGRMLSARLLGPVSFMLFQLLLFRQLPSRRAMGYLSHHFRQNMPGGHLLQRQEEAKQAGFFLRCAGPSTAHPPDLCNRRSNKLTQPSWWGQVGPRLAVTTGHS